MSRPNQNARNHPPHLLSGLRYAGASQQFRYLDYFLNAREDHTTAHYALNMGELAREQRRPGSSPSTTSAT